MKITQIYTGCLSQGAYYIESKGEVAIIDPLREVQPYIDTAKKDGASIKYVFETHFHADFVSGHVTLAEKTGANIVFGPTAAPSFKAHIAQDNEVFTLGEITLTLLHTPGHTLESSTILLKDAHGKDHAIFSGDTLFLGDVGRPDLAQKSTLSLSDLAGMLFDSLRNKIMPLADDVLVYPAHGAGSSCGKNLSTATVDTLGHQKKTNYALRASMSKQEFIDEVTTGLLPPPAYFPLNVQLNKEGYQPIETVLQQGTQALSVADFETKALETGAIILDVRHQSLFLKGHVPNAIFIGIDGGFAPWVGALLKDITQPILLIAPKDTEAAVVTRLARVGFDNVLGFLAGGFDAWRAAGKEVATISSVSAAVLAEKMPENALVFDVRKPGEYTNEHLVGVPNTPLDYLHNHFNDFPRETPFYVHCAGGYRSVIAASILKARGFHQVIDVAGGYREIKQTQIPRTATACPSTLT